ncbi:MAG: hypothetical protein MR508_00190 [Lachnospiraceae bacterium]|nr:hypothetical protein [Lachnospiraceae bacterium]
MKNFLQLTGLRPDPFGSSVEESKNFPDSIEGKDEMEKLRKIWEAKGLVCICLTMPVPETAG